MTTLTYPSITAAAKFRAAMVAGFVYRAGGNIRSCRKTSILLGQLGQCLSYYSLSQIRVAAAKMEKIETYWPQKKKKTFLWAKKTIPMDVGVPTFGFELPNLSFAEKRCWDGGCSPGYDADTRVFKPKLCEAEWSWQTHHMNGLGKPFNCLQTNDQLSGIPPDTFPGVKKWFLTTIWFLAVNIVDST